MLADYHIRDLHFWINWEFGLSIFWWNGTFYWFTGGGYRPVSSSISLAVFWLVADWFLGGLTVGLYPTKPKLWHHCRENTILYPPQFLPISNSIPLLSIVQFLKLMRGDATWAFYVCGGGETPRDVIHPRQRSNLGVRADGDAWGKHACLICLSFSWTFSLHNWNLWQDTVAKHTRRREKGATWGGGNWQI